MMKIGGNFLLCLSCRATLHFKDQVSPTCIKEDLRLCFHWGVSRAQYIDTLSWFNVVFAYRDHGSDPILWPWVFPNTSKVIQIFQIQIQTKNCIAKYNVNTKTESCLNPNSCHCYWPERRWRRDYGTFKVEFVAAIEERSWLNV